MIRRNFPVIIFLPPHLHLCCSLQGCNPGFLQILNRNQSWKYPFRSVSIPGCQYPESFHLHLDSMDRCLSEHQEVWALSGCTLLRGVVCMYRRRKFPVPIRLVRENHLVQDLTNYSVSSFRQSVCLRIVRSGLPVFDKILCGQIHNYIVEKKRSSITYQLQRMSKPDVAST
jgi:hypothetical protein